MKLMMTITTTTITTICLAIAAATSIVSLPIASTCNALLIAPILSLPLSDVSMTATAHALGLVFALSTGITSPTTTSTTTTQSPTRIVQQIQNQNLNLNEAVGGGGGPIPILEIVKVFGKLAGSECYGKKAPSGSSCQIQLNDIQQTVSTLSRNEFELKLQNSNDYEFQWPLKPYGIDKSLSKTATMNKGAETRVFMDELEYRGLYNPRNPTGPLPTSLRPALNKELQNEGILDPRAIDITYNAFKTTNANTNNNKKDDGDNNGDNNNNNNGEYVDYYNFLKMIGTDSISWPK
ncbi:MAG: hypothetical protein ACI90V_010194 [Bacillariaceae sp.]|jgi:hypothetical protein